MWTDFGYIQETFLKDRLYMEYVTSNHMDAEPNRPEPNRENFIFRISGFFFLITAINLDVSIFEISIF